MGKDFQSIIALSREYGLVTWHVYIGEVTEDVPEPETKMIWDDKGGKTIQQE